MKRAPLMKLCAVCREPFKARPLESICGPACAWKRNEEREAKALADAEVEARFRKMAGGA